MKIKQIFKGLLIFLSLLLLYNIFYIIGALAVSSLIPNIQSEPGILSNNLGLLIIGIVNTLLIISLIKCSKLSGLKLIIGLSFSYYGVSTFLTQIETWYFLSKITVTKELLFRLFIMGLPISFIFIPLAIWVLGKGKIIEPYIYTLSFKQWFKKLGIISIVYVALYWISGYFIAWQNPDLRFFYGSSVDIIPFWEHTISTINTDPWLLPFQVLRGLLWAFFSIIIIQNSKTNLWLTMSLMAAFLTVPQLLGLLLENPLMPNASVRLSHFIEGIVSNVAFAIFLSWQLYPKNKK